jgi:hypothetical protein
VRGSSLAYPPVLETLRPFIVTYASARSVEDFPEDVRALCGPPGQRPRNMNLGLMVLAADGKLVRQLVPFIRPPAFHCEPEAQGKDFKRQLDQLLDGVPLPPASSAPRRLALPDVPGKGDLAGVRVYLTFGANRLNHFRTPTVEAVAMTEKLRERLRYPETALTLEADALRPWLEQIYPPAVMDGKGGFERIAGTLTLRPAGRRDDIRYALISGEVQFALDNKTRIAYEGKLSIVLEYAPGAVTPRSVRGVCDCIFPKHNPEGRVVERIQMTAALESRPH